MAVNRAAKALARVEYGEEVLRALHPDRPIPLTRPYREGAFLSPGPPTPGSTISIPVRDPSTGRVAAFHIVNGAEGAPSGPRTRGHCGPSGRR